MFPKKITDLFFTIQNNIAQCNVVRVSVADFYNHNFIRKFGYVVVTPVRPFEYSCHLNSVYILSHCQIIFKNLSHSQIIFQNLIGNVLQMRNNVFEFSFLPQGSIKGKNYNFLKLSLVHCLCFKVQTNDSLAVQQVSLEDVQ